MQANPPKDTAESTFTFYDTHGNTVKILYVQYTDGSIRAALHRSVSYVIEDLRKRDTLEFHFYGYKTYTFISGRKINQDYAITLKPVFQPAFFNGAVFRVKRNQLIGEERKVRFRKRQSAP